MKLRFKIFTSIFICSLIAGSVSAQDEKISKYGNDSVNCVMNNSLYYEFFRQWKASDYKNNSWKDAYGPWRWVFLNCPQSTINIFLHGENILEEVINNETNKDAKEKYIDTLMMLYDNRIKYYGNEGFVLGKKGVDLYKLRPESYEEAYSILKKSIELEAMSSSGPSIIYYFRAAEKLVKNGKSDTTLLVDIYDQSTEIVDQNLATAQNAGEAKAIANWENIKGNIELSFEPYATCKDLIRIYTLKFNSNSEDVNLLKKITKILDKKNCTDSDLFFKATENLHKAEPSAKTAELMGKMYIKREDYNKATEYLLQAVKLYEDINDRSDVYFLLANVYYQMKQFSNARTQCYEILKLKPNEGKTLILIGDLYASSAKECGDNALTERAAYWAAVDKYYKAKSVDPSVEENANKKISEYSKYFPANETIFFYGLTVGESYTVGCWINENTTVRSSD
jgi:tetratricopeptide (TPR) repeat protein